MEVWLLAMAVMVPVFGLMAVSRNRRRQATARVEAAELHVDEFGVRRRLVDGREEQLDWTDVNEVEVLTAKSGPHAKAGGVVILCGDETHGCLVPIDRLEDSGVAEALTRLPGFDSHALVAALGAKPPTRTTCWRRGS
jgi:hypothetical protein